MSDFVFAVNTVVPIFIVVFVGAALRRLQIVNEEFVQRSSTIVFRVALPLLIFEKMRTADFAAGSLAGPVSIFMAVTLTCFSAVWLVAHRVVAEGPSRGVVVQGAFRSNIAIMGIPIVANLEASADMALAIMVLAFVMPVYNILAVVVLSVTAKSEKRPSVSSVSKSILTNPLIIAVIVGMLMRSVTVPALAVRSIDTLAGLTIPLALLGIGASLGGRALIGKAPLAIGVAGIKTVLLPAAVCVVAWFLNIRDDRLATLFVVSGAPSAVSSFIMAKAMKADGELAASIVFFSTLMALPTLSVGIYIMRVLGAV